MAHRLTTAAATAVVTTGEAVEHIRPGDPVAEASHLDALIDRATRHCEQYCKRAFITQTWTLTMDGWNDCRYAQGGLIYVPRPRLIAVTSITYLDSDGTSQTLAADQYRVDAQNEPGRIEPAYGVSWPTTRGVVGDVTITHTAGYGAAASVVPPDIKHAILLLAGHYYENREASLIGVNASELPFSVACLLDPYVMESYA